MSSLHGYDAFRRQEELRAEEALDSRSLEQKIYDSLAGNEVGRFLNLAQFTKAAEALCQKRPPAQEYRPGQNEVPKATRYIHVVDLEKREQSLLETLAALRQQYKRVSPLFYPWLQFADLRDTLMVPEISSRALSDGPEKDRVVELWSEARRDEKGEEYWALLLRQELQKKQSLPSGIVLLGGANNGAELSEIEAWQTEEI